MSIQTIARRYAAALADVVLDRGEAKEIQQELQQWAELILTNANLAGSVPQSHDSAG